MPLDVDIPPHSLSMERILVASCLVFPESAMAAAQRWVDHGSFYDSRNRAIWLALDEFMRARNPPDMHLFVDFLTNRSLLMDCGGMDYLWEAASQDAWSAANAEDYARAVAAYAERRGYIAAGKEIVRQAKSGDPDADLGATAAGILRGISKPAGGDPASIHEGLPDFADMDPEKVFGPAVMSGIWNLDATLRIGGEKLIIVGARPGHGKTALAMTISVNAAYEQKLPVLFYSLEQKPLELKINALSQITGVEAQRIHAGNLSKGETSLLNGIKPGLAKMPLSFVNAKGWSLSRIVSHAEAASLTRRFGLIVVDYIGLIDFSQRTGKGSPENRQQQIAEASMGLKALTGKLGCPVMVLSQLSREIEKRTDKRPQLSDLRESGSLEQDADAVLFPYRPAAHKGGSEPEYDVEIIVAKNKNAKPGLVEAVYQPRTMKFIGRGFAPHTERD